MVCNLGCIIFTTHQFTALLSHDSHLCSVSSGGGLQLWCKWTFDAGKYFKQTTLLRLPVFIVLWIQIFQLKTNTLDISDKINMRTRIYTSIFICDYLHLFGYCLVWFCQHDWGEEGAGFVAFCSLLLFFILVSRSTDMMSSSFLVTSALH